MAIARGDTPDGKRRDSTTPLVDRTTLGEMTVRDLLRTARREALAFGESMDRRQVGDLLDRAYVGSIAARISVALDKLEEVMGG